MLTFGSVSPQQFSCSAGVCAANPMTHPNVFFEFARLQVRLNALSGVVGFKPLVTDGKLGNNTLTAWRMVITHLQNRMPVAFTAVQKFASAAGLTGLFQIQNVETLASNADAASSFIAQVIQLLNLNLPADETVPGAPAGGGGGRPSGGGSGGGTTLVPAPDSGGSTGSGGFTMPTWGWVALGLGVLGAAWWLGSRPEPGDEAAPAV